ncbi:MAG: hypothetical protein ACEPOW_10380 [Bacteroidales bacterium]
MARKITSYCIIDSKGIKRNNGFQDFASGNTFKENIDTLIHENEIKNSRLGRMDPMSVLGFVGTELLLDNRKISEEYDPYDIGIVFSNNSSSLDTDLKYWDSVKKIASPSLFVYTLPNVSMAEICIKNCIKGENHFFLSQKIDLKLIYEQCSTLFDQELSKVIITGWVDYFQDDYKAVLFIIEDGNGEYPDFTEENLNKILKQ